MADPPLPGMEPHVIAEHDQLLAAAKADLDRLLRTVQLGADEVGELQAMADHPAAFP